MRIKTMTTILSLAIIAASTFAAEAQRAGGPNHGGGQNRSSQIDTSDRGAGDAESINRRRLPCYVVGAASVDCPPKKKTVLNLTPKEDDCQCKPVALSVNGTTQWALDCYQTRIVNEVKRTFVCARPE
jgi:hypothetical protein